MGKERMEMKRKKLCGSKESTPMALTPWGSGLPRGPGKHQWRRQQWRPSSSSNAARITTGANSPQQLPSPSSAPQHPTPLLSGPSALLPWSPPALSHPAPHPPSTLHPLLPPQPPPCPRAPSLVTYLDKLCLLPQASLPPATSPRA